MIKPIVSVQEVLHRAMTSKEGTATIIRGGKRTYEAQDFRNENNERIVQLYRNGVRLVRYNLTKSTVERFVIHSHIDMRAANTLLDYICHNSDEFFIMTYGECQLCTFKVKGA